MKVAVEKNLESILRKHHYKKMDVVIDTDFAGKHQDLENDESSSDIVRKDSLECLQEESNSEPGEAARHTAMEEDEEYPVKEGADAEVDVDSKKGKKPGRDFVEENRIKVMNMQSVLKIIDKANVELVSQNIPYLSNTTNFSRAELHTFYTMYKALCYVTSQQYGIMQYGKARGLTQT